MARAFEQLPIGVPIGHLAAGVHANCGIGDHPFGGALLGFVIEALGVEAQQQHLVEARAVTHGLRFRIHRPRERLFAVARQVVRFQGLWISRGAHRNQQVAFFRTLACRIGLGRCRSRGQSKAQAQPDRRPPPNALELVIHPVSQHELAPAVNNTTLQPNDSPSPPLGAGREYLRPPGPPPKWRAGRRSAGGGCACRSRRRWRCTKPARRAAAPARRRRSMARRCCWARSTHA